MIVTGSNLHRVYGTGEAEVRALDGVDVAIDDGRFVAGDRLPPIAEMARRFRVARATVREALFKLELLRVVEIRHGTGVYVRVRSADERAA